jgi:hypothetical protein
MSDPAAWQRPQYGAPPGWTPPPKPGLIPLRPLTFGQLLSTPFQVLRRNVGALFGPAVLIQAIVLVANLLVVGAAVAAMIFRLSRASDADQPAIIAGSVATVGVAAFVGLAFSVIGNAVLQGLVVIEVANGVLGHRPRARQLWTATRGRRWAVVGYVALLAAAVVVGLALLGGAVAALAVPAAAANGDPVLIVLAALVGLVGGLGLLVLAAWVWAKTSLAPSVIMLERAGVRAGIARSWRLVRGGFWRVFGAQALVVLICSVASQIVTSPVSILYTVGIGLAFPTGGPGGDVNGAALGLSVASYALLMLVSLVIGAVTAVVQAAASCLVYVDQRMRREGLDLVLSRYVEDVQAGRPGGDPFATPEHAATA